MNKQWDAIKDRVTTLQTDTDNIQKYQAWFGQSFGTLNIWAKLTMALPSVGTVTLKSFDIREQNMISAHGTAQSIQDFNVMRENLARTPGVTDLHADTAGLAPQIQYNLTYQWKPRANQGTTHGN